MLNKASLSLSLKVGKARYDSGDRSFCVDSCAVRRRGAGHSPHLRCCRREFGADGRCQAGGARAISLGPHGVLLSRLCVCGKRFLRAVCRSHIEFPAPAALSAGSDLGRSRRIAALVDLYSDGVDVRRHALLRSSSRSHTLPHSRRDGSCECGISFVHVDGVKSV